MSLRRSGRFCLLVILTLVSANCGGGSSELTSANAQASPTPPEEAGREGPAVDYATAPTEQPTEEAGREGPAADHATAPTEQPTDSDLRGVLVLSISDADDQTPVGTAHVEARPHATSSSSAPEPAGVSESDGRYVLRVASGAWRVQVTAPGYRPLATTVAVAEATVATLEIRLTRST